MEKIKEKITIENMLCLLIIICPILDMASFIFRNVFNTSISPSTFLRPIIPICAILYIFIKKPVKLKLLIAVAIYGLYAIIHLVLFNLVKTGSSYSGLIHELQYLVNYSFMILNLFIYMHIFKNDNCKKLKKSVVVAITIYITSIFVSILTNTSSSTYIEKMGYKGWFESGNSISSILILSMFIILNLVKNKKYKYWVIVLTVFVGIYLTMLIGTRVGLFGFILVLFIYAAVEILVAILNRVQLNKNILIGSICAIVVVTIVVGIVRIYYITKKKTFKRYRSKYSRRIK